MSNYSILTDIHTHTLFSRHAYSTIAENVTAAAEHGLELLGSSDHFSSMLFGEPSIKNYQFFNNQVIWPRVWKGVTLLRGAEVDISTLDGTFFGQGIPCPANIMGAPYRTERDLFQQATSSLDYLVASVHSGDFTKGASIAQTTAMYIAALEHPKVMLLGHTGRAGIPFDVDEVLIAAKKLGKLIEINEHSFDSSDQLHGACREIAERAAELGVGISVSSDAHMAMYIGKFPHATTLLEEIHFPEELVMNRNRDTLLDAMAAVKVCDVRSAVRDALAAGATE